MISRPASRGQQQRIGGGRRSKKEARGEAFVTRQETQVQQWRDR
jgi:hypothetical protein